MSFLTDEVLLHLHDGLINVMDRLLANTRRRRTMLAHRQRQRATATRRAIPLADDVLRDILPFLSSVDLYALSMTCWRWHCYAQPLAERFGPHFVPELAIEEALGEEDKRKCTIKVQIVQSICQEGPTPVTVRVGDEHFDQMPPSTTSHLLLPTTSPPANILGFRLIRFPNGNVGAQSVQFLLLCQPLIIPQRTKLCIKCSTDRESKDSKNSPPLLEEICGRVELDIDGWHGNDGELLRWMRWLRNGKNNRISLPTDGKGAKVPFIRRLTLSGTPTEEQKVRKTVSELLAEFRSAIDPSYSVSYVLLLMVRPLRDGQMDHLPLMAEENDATEEMFVAWRCDARDDGNFYKILRCKRGHLMEVLNEGENIESEIRIG